MSPWMNQIKRYDIRPQKLLVEMTEFNLFDLIPQIIKNIWILDGGQWYWEAAHQEQWRVSWGIEPVTSCLLDSDICKAAEKQYKYLQERRRESGDDMKDESPNRLKLMLTIYTMGLLNHHGATRTTKSRLPSPFRSFVLSTSESSVLQHFDSVPSGHWGSSTLDSSVWAPCVVCLPPCSVCPSSPPVGRPARLPHLPCSSLPVLTLLVVSVVVLCSCPVVCDSCSSVLFACAASV